MNKEDTLINIQTSNELEYNAFELLSSAIDILRDFNIINYNWSDYKLKSAILCVATSVELILKSKIASDDWRQLFQDLSKANEISLKNGEFKSINIDCCVKKIENVCSIKLDTITKSKITDVRNIRNKLAHFHSDIEKDTLISLIIFGIDVFIEFYKKYIYFKSDYYDNPDKTKEIDMKLKNVKEYTNVRLKTIKEKYSNYKYPRNRHLEQCSICEQENSIVLKDENTVICIYCGDESDIKDMALLRSFFNNEIKTCPACKRESMAAVHMNEKEEKAWDCIICGYYINRPTNWSNKNVYSWTGIIQDELII